MLIVLDVVDSGFRSCRDATPFEPMNTEHRPYARRVSQQVFCAPGPPLWLIASAFVKSAAAVCRICFFLFLLLDSQR